MLARIKQLEMCNREMFGDVVVTCQTPPKIDAVSRIEPYAPPVAIDNKSGQSLCWEKENERRRASLLVDQLLSEIYTKIGNGSSSNNSASDYNSATSSKSGKNCRVDEKFLWGKSKY